MNWELIISAIALLISGFAALYSYFQGKKSNSLQEEQTALQRRVVQLEEQREKKRHEEQIRANVKAEVMYRDTAAGKKPYKLRVANQGAGAAQNVRIIIDGEPVSKCNFILTEQNSIEVIAAGSDMKFPLATSKDSPSNWKTVILWDDKTGTDNKFETILTK